MVDVLDACGSVDTLDILSQRDVNIVTSGEKMFPCVTSRDADVPRFRGNKVEYASLVARQLHASRLRLRCHLQAGGACFYISKPGKDALRHIWNGNSLSAASAPAPPPRFLANPSAFLHLRASDDAPLYLSTRDCRSWFEQLRLPHELRPFMAQQPVFCRDLLKRPGITIELLRSFFDDLPTPLTNDAVANLKVYPVS